MNATVWVITKSVQYEGDTVKAVVPNKPKAIPKVLELTNEHRYDGEWETLSDRDNAYSKSCKDVAFVAKPYEVEE
jgi:lipocalin